MLHYLDLEISKRVPMLYPYLFDEKYACKQALTYPKTTLFPLTKVEIAMNQGSWSGANCTEAQSPLIALKQLKMD